MTMRRYILAVMLVISLAAIPCFAADGDPVRENKQMTGTLKTAQGTDVAGANAMTLGDGNFFDITGTTTINTIATKGIGTFVVLEFDGILQLTHSADLFMPTAANVTTAAGDIAVFYEYATGDWRCLAYTRANGKALAETAEADTLDTVTGRGATTTNAITVGSSTVQGAAGAAGVLALIADAAEDNSDSWRISVADGGDYTLESYQSGSWVAVFTIDNTGNVTVAADHAATSYTADPDTAPGIAMIDVDGDDNDVSGKIYHNLTTTTGAAEIGDWYWQVMGGAGTAGTLETFMHFDGSGEQLNIMADLILSGGAKVTRDLAFTLIKGSGTATNETITGAQCIMFDADGETAYISVQAPLAWDAASDLTFHALIQNEIAETDGDDISFTVTVHGMQDGDTAADAGQDVTFTQDLTGGDEGQNRLNEVEGVIDYDDGTYPIAAGDTIVIKLAVNLAEGTECTGGLAVVHWGIEYTADKLGTAQ